jgi:uncharacterized protein (DUF2141 family)
MVVALTLGFGLCVASMHSTWGAELEVRVEGLKSDEGMVRFALFAGAEGYPKDSTKAVQRGSVAIQNKQALIKVKSLPAGNYALSVIHDQNSNDKLDTGLFGIPTEGIGASNDAKGSFGPPSFDNAKFEVTSEGKKISLKMQYLF